MFICLTIADVQYLYIMEFDNIKLYKQRPTSIGLPDLVDSVYKKVNRQLTMIEIGSYIGESMEIFAKTGKLSTIICIDPWYTYQKSGIGIVEKQFDLCQTNVVNSTFTNIIKHKGILDDFILTDIWKNYKNNIDFVYIDGNHQYNFVKHDIEVCLNDIKPLIAICGHDYYKNWPDVVKAVNEFFYKPDLIFSDTSWLKFQTNYNER